MNNSKSGADEWAAIALVLFLIFALIVAWYVIAAVAFIGSMISSYRLYQKYQHYRELAGVDFDKLSRQLGLGYDVDTIDGVFTAMFPGLEFVADERGENYDWVEGILAGDLVEPVWDDDVA